MNNKKETKLYSFTQILKKEFEKHEKKISDDKSTSDDFFQNYKRKKYAKLRELLFSLTISDYSFKEGNYYFFTRQFCNYFSKLLFAERGDKENNSKHKKFIKGNFDSIPVADLQEIEKIIEGNMTALNKSEELIELQIINYRLRTKLHIREKIAYLDLDRDFQSDLLSVFDEHGYLTQSDQVFLTSLMIERQKIISYESLHSLNSYRDNSIKRIKENEYPYLEIAEHVLFLIGLGYDKNLFESFNVPYCHYENSNQRGKTRIKFYSLENPISIQNAARDTTDKLFEEYEVDLNLGMTELIKNLELLKRKMYSPQNKELKQCLIHQGMTTKQILTCQKIDLINCKIHQEWPEFSVEIMKQIMSQD